MNDSLPSSCPPSLAAEEVVFLLVVEHNRLEPQALLFCESLRTFGGRYAQSAILAVSPRPELAVGAASRKRLEQLGVDYRVEPLNRTGSPYGTINRIVVGAWAEATRAEPYLVVLDTDMLWVSEPSLVRRAVGVRPVDLKGSASSGKGDPFDSYWQRLAVLGGVELGRLPFLRTTMDGATIRASYNGGFAVVRRDLGILEATRAIFFASLAAGLRPRASEGIDIFASTGSVGIEASEWWGSSQAALSLAITSKTSDVAIYDARYNIPLHLLANADRSWPLPLDAEPAAPILLHYHYLAEPAFRADFRRALVSVGCAPAVVAWIEERLGAFDSKVEAVSG